MPFSGTDGVPQALEFIEKRYQKDIRILDIGAGAGWRGKNIKELGYLNIDAVEIHTPFINRTWELDGKPYKIGEIYKNIYNVNALDFKNYDDYDLVFSWKTFEHFTVEDCRKLIDMINPDLMFSVPYNQPQGVCEGNVHEIHHQDDLTSEMCKELYPEFYEIWTLTNDKGAGTGVYFREAK